MPRFPVDASDRKPLGRTGESIPAIVLGTWAIRDYRAAEEVLVEAVERGLYAVDTAEMYGGGRAEELVGRVVERVGRDRVFIITKMLPDRLASREEVEKAARRALQRLGVGEVDLYLIHWPNPSLTIAEQVRNFEIVYEKGYARHIGVSNFDKREVEEAMAATRKAEIVADQVKYSVLDKAVETSSLLGFLADRRVQLQAYTPLERGRVANHPVLVEVAREAGKTPVQVALNYVISRPMTVAVVKTERRDHLEEITGALGWRLTPEQLERLEAI